MLRVLYIKTAELSSKTFSASQGLTNGVFHEQFFPFDPFPPGECIYYDEALERLTKLQTLSLADIHVNMFKAFNNHLINDGCGLFRGRQILPFEHLSRFQNDMID